MDLVLFILEASFEKFCHLFLKSLFRQFAFDYLFHLAVGSYEYSHGKMVNAIVLSGLSVRIA